MRFLLAVLVLLIAMDDTFANPKPAPSPKPNPEAMCGPPFCDWGKWENGGMGMQSGMGMNSGWECVARRCGFSAKDMHLQLDHGVAACVVSAANSHA